VAEHGPSVLLEEVNEGWRFTVRDHYGETQGWEPTYAGAAAQARHVINAHRVVFAGPQTRATGATFESSSPDREGAE
jgi:hypothetical protein